MSYYNTRRILTLEESSRKRKDRDTPFYYSSSKATPFNKQAEPSPHQMPNPVLAGYLAYEYLTKGTLMGQKFDPAKAKAVPVNKRKEAEPKMEPSQSQSYVEVASLMRNDGTHIPGIVNPTQLAQWIQM